MPTHLVTGAGSGIGAAVARQLVARGDDVVLLVRSAERAAELRSAFPTAAFLTADLQGDDLAARLDEQRRESGWDTLDSVIHVAGVADLAPVADLAASSLQQTLAVNLVAPTLLTAWALPFLRRTRGTVVFVNSTAALSVNANWGAYAASKAGLRAVADAVRAEEAANGVRVSTIFPSRTATAMQQRVREQEGGEYVAERYLEAETVAASIVGVLDLPRDATAPEITLRPGPR